jgi:hypothetical protein
VPQIHATVRTEVCFRPVATARTEPQGNPLRSIVIVFVSFLCVHTMRLDDDEERPQYCSPSSHEGSRCDSHAKRPAHTKSKVADYDGRNVETQRSKLLIFLLSRNEDEESFFVN